jgi:hypothetical protein
MHFINYIKIIEHMFYISKELKNGFLKHNVPLNIFSKFKHESGGMLL